MALQFLSARAVRLFGKTSDFSGSASPLELLLASRRKRSPRLWNEWRKAHPRVAPDLEGVVLAGRVLRGLNLARSRLDAALLDRVDLRGAHLERAFLKGVSLRFANLSHVHAEGAELSGADLTGANLVRHVDLAIVNRAEQAAAGISEMREGRE